MSVFKPRPNKEEKPVRFWKTRSSRGRDVIFFDPDFLWMAACEYFESVDARTWDAKDWVGKDAKEVKRQHLTPYTLSGLCLFLDVNPGYLTEFKESAAYREDVQFSVIIARIENIIRTQQLEGAMTGFFNPMLTAKLCELVDKKDITSGGNALAPRVEVVSQQTAEDLDKL